MIAGLLPLWINVDTFNCVYLNAAPADTRGTICLAHLSRGERREAAAILGEDAGAGDPAGWWGRGAPGCQGTAPRLPPLTSLSPWS